MAKGNLLYKIKITAEGEEKYNQITDFLEDNSILKTFDGKYHHYQLKNGQARANQKKKTIELTDEVDGDIKDTVHFFNITEKKENN